MHSIERYGIVALLFLVVTVVAVLLWDGDKKKPKGVAAAPSTTSAHDLGVKRGPGVTIDEHGEERKPGSLLTLQAEGQPGPLYRSVTPGGPKEGTSEGSEARGLQTRASETQGAQRSHDDLARPSAESRGSGAPTLGAGLENGARATLTPKASVPKEQPVVDRPIAGLSSAAQRDTHTYLVRSGDTLSEIAQRELGSARRWPEIVAANPGLDANRLPAGESIQLPGAAALQTKGGAGATPDAGLARSQVNGSPANRSAGSGTWKVGQGESLWKIAQRALGDGQRWREIAALNPTLQPDKLVLGQVLVLPAASTPAAKGSGTQVAGVQAPAKKSADSLVASAANPGRSTRSPSTTSRSTTSQGKVK